MTERLYTIADVCRDLAQVQLLTGVLSASPDGLVHRSVDDVLARPEPGAFLGAGLDNRQLIEHQLFVALPGEHVDGRQFAPQALAAGHWVLTGLAVEPNQDPLRGLPSTKEAGVVLVSDPVAALAALAAAWRTRIGVTVAGVTGTNGKTTTKDLLAAALSGAGSVHATAGNFNNQLGLPLTLLGLRQEHDFAVLEMGASAVGDIAALAPLASPQVGIITNAAPAHLAKFGSLEEIIQGKGELLDVLPASGAAILNTDSPGFAQWAQRAPCPVVSFGQDSGSVRWQWSASAGTAAGPCVHLANEKWDVPLPGQHNGANLVAAILAGRALGVTDTELRAGFSRFSASPHRSALLQIGERWVLDDSYNANPRSMLVAGQALLGLPGSGQTIAVLGHMAELGAESSTIHQETGTKLAALGLDVLLAVGPQAEALAKGFDAGGGRSVYWATQPDAAAWLAANTQPDDRLLLKGSRSAAMEDMLPLLTDLLPPSRKQGR